MKKKTIKPTKPTPEYDSQRETRVLLEEMNHGIKTIGEQHGSMVKRLDNIESKLSQHDQELQIIKSVLQSNSSELKSVKLSIKDVDDRTQRILQSNSSELKSVKLAIKDVDDRTQRILQSNSLELKSVKLSIKDVDDRTQRIEKKLDTVTTDHEYRLQKLETVEQIIEDRSLKTSGKN